MVFNHILEHEQITIKLASTSQMSMVWNNQWTIHPNVAMAQNHYDQTLANLTQSITNPPKSLFLVNEEIM